MCLARAGPGICDIVTALFGRPRQQLSTGQILNYTFQTSMIAIARTILISNGNDRHENQHTPGFRAAPRTVGNIIPTLAAGAVGIVLVTIRSIVAVVVNVTATSTVVGTVTVSFTATVLLLV